jgi:hypothetical protein
VKPGEIIPPEQLQRFTLAQEARHAYKLVLHDAGE